MSSDSADELIDDLEARIDELNKIDDVRKKRAEFLKTLTNDEKDILFKIEKDIFKDFC